MEMPSFAAASPGSGATTDSSSGENELPQRPRGRRAPRKRGKPTYYLRKDEIRDLQDQVAQLQDELKHLKTAPTLQDASALGGVFTQSIQTNNRTLAGTQSLLSSATLSMVHNVGAVPLSTHIHLPVDPLARDHVLQTIRGPKLQTAYEYMTERLRFLDLRMPHRQGECFDLPNGDAINTGFDIMPFEAGHTLHEVYDEFKFWLQHQEISISEKLGVLTIRESDEMENFTYGQTRLLTTILDGVEIESNIALFMTCEDGTDEQPSFALAATDFVDQDDLYPYRSAELGRKEVTGAVLMIEVPTPDGGRAVSMCRWSFVRFRGPLNGTNPGQRSAVRDAMAILCDSMPKMMMERLALRARLARKEGGV